MMLSKVECSPRRIIQIVSGSRSGSTLLKSLLAGSPDVISLVGEEEPYVKLSGNGYGMTSDSDTFSELKNPSLFRRLLETELTTEDFWEWRLRLQFVGTTLARLIDSLPRMNQDNPRSWLREQGIEGLYDTPDKEKRQPFTEGVAYEMPPFVFPRRLGIPSAGKTLLLKCPYNVYRKGILEKVFPDTEFTYVILTRNPAATVNGLIDGWEANYGFHKHLTEFGWWKFDMPAGWRDYVHRTIAERAWFQWSSSYSLAREWSGFWVRFEDLVKNPSNEVRRICRELNISPPENVSLSLQMSTEAPTPYRWKKRAAQILPLLERSVGLIEDMGYTETADWV